MRLTCETAKRTIRHVMDRDEPGWLTTSFLCPSCRDYHDLVFGEKQLGMGSDPVNQGIHPQKRGLPPVKRGTPEGWCIWHETASPPIIGAMRLLPGSGPRPQGHHGPGDIGPG